MDLELTKAELAIIVAGIRALSDNDRTKVTYAPWARRQEIVDLAKKLQPTLREAWK